MTAPAGTDPFTEWDAAYVLGALSADDRAAFEEHLGQCRSCRRRIAELAGLPGILSAVPAEDALRLVQDEPPGLTGAPEVDRDDLATGSNASATVSAASRESSGTRDQGSGPASTPRANPGPEPDLSTLIARVQRSRRRRRQRVVLAGAAGIAAALIVLLAVVVPGLRPDTRELDLTLAPVTETSLTATARLSATADGTQLSTTCNYGPVDRGDAEYRDGTGQGTFGLFVTTTDGAVQEVATWAAGPGETVRATGHIAVDLDRIQSVQIGPSDRAEVLLQADLGP